MDPILKDFSASSLIAAIEGNIFALTEFLGNSPYVEFYQDPEITWFSNGIKHSNAMFNAISLTRLKKNDIPVRIKMILKDFQSRHIPITWWTSPSTQPVDLGEHLKACSMICDGERPSMAVPLSSLDKKLINIPELSIKRVENEKTLQNWIDAFTEGFDLPDSIRQDLFHIEASLGLIEDSPYQRYVGFLKDRPVATSSVFYGAGVAGIYHVTTILESRGKGIGSALTLQPLRDAFEKGYMTGILHSTPQGVNVYKKLGFKEYCKFWVYKMKSGNYL